MQHMLEHGRKEDKKRILGCAKTRDGKGLEAAPADSGFLSEGTLFLSMSCADPGMGCWF